MTTLDPDTTPAESVVIPVHDLRRAIDRLEAAELRNGPTSWFGRHQAWTIAIATGVVGLVSWGVNQWTREQVHEIQAPRDEKQDAAITAVDDKVDTETKERIPLLDHRQLL